MAPLTRRELLKKAVVLTAGSSVYLGSYAMPTPASMEDKTRVILVRDKDLLDEKGKIVPSVMEDMLNRALCNLYGVSSPSEAWKKVAGPSDIVGVKSNNWRFLPTPPELEAVIEKGLIQAGVKKENISIRDRGVLNDPVFQKATALINTRPMRTHYWSGVGSLIKNYILFDPNPPKYHPDTCADLAKLWELPLVKNKTRLNILVMVTPLFHGSGPHHFNEEYTWPYKGIIVGTDPVAVDSVGLRIIQAKRKQFFGDDRPLNPPAKHIYLADTRHHLGTADPAKIDLITIGWAENQLI
ncbi:MAG TPA: DUF362 domain-containing protein [Bacteroidales bacterium]|nr:DUF362 domain-containing protein [Bacteroidales bacterium]